MALKCRKCGASIVSGNSKAARKCSKCGHQLAEPAAEAGANLVDAIHRRFGWTGLILLSALGYVGYRLLLQK